MGEGGVDGLPFSSQASSSDATTCNTPIFCDKESIIVSATIPVHAFGGGGQEEIKTVSAQTRRICSLSPWCNLNWLNGRVGGKPFFLLGLLGLLYVKKDIVTTNF